MDRVIVVSAEEWQKAQAALSEKRSRVAEARAATQARNNQAMQDSFAIQAAEFAQSRGPISDNF